jgi:hypothetical protein
MPIDKYIVIRKAAEIDEIICRLNMITDINAAFSGNKTHVKELEQKFHKLIGQKEDLILGNKKDPDWAKRLQKYKR